LLAILAQMGAFVPAEAARLGLVDRVFSRVGAADDLAAGRSTFMVEMVETATILNQATERSLVILDEIGRGTATYDGLAIAWATLEHLHDVNRCRGLFATHYHELTRLRERLAALSCHTMRVREWQGAIIFLHEVAPGAAEASYGLHVARLAGLPTAVIDRARAVLEALEGSGEEAMKTGQRLDELVADLPLFAAMDVASRAGERAVENRQRPGDNEVRPAPSPDPSPVEEALRAVNPDDLSPREALERLYSLKAMLS
jgi:DNA mismatch repair protein MutS